MKSKLKLLNLLLMFFLHVYKTSPAAPSIDESEVKSFVVERKSLIVYDYFTVNMKSNGKCTDGTVDNWCRSLDGHKDGTKGNHSSCSCYCYPRFYSFIPPRQTCINVTTAAIFGGCESYFNKDYLLAQLPVDLTKRSSNPWFLKVNTADSCSLVGNNTYFNYSGFHGKWETIDDGFFFLSQQGYVSWKKDATLSPKLSGRIIRLVVQCSSRTSCFLFKSLGKVTYYGPVRSSTSSSHPTVSSSSSESSQLSTLSSSTSSSAPHPPSSSSASSALSPSPSLMLSSSAGTLGVSQSTSSFHPSTQSENTRLPTLITGQISSTLKAGLESLLPIKSDDALEISTRTPSHSTNTVIYSIEPSQTTTVVSSSSAADVVPGDSGKRTTGNDNGVIIGTAVGGAVVLGILVLIIVFWKRRKACENTEEQIKPVKNPVYGSSSNNEIQLEVPKGSKMMPSVALDTQPTYQSLINDNGPSDGAAIYSSAEDDYDNCTVYQSLDKQIPGSPVYGRLNKGLPEPAHTTGQPNLKPKGKTGAAGVPTSKANGVTGLPKPKPTPTPTGQLSDRPRVAQENVYNVLDGPGMGQGTTPEPLYNVLEGTDSGQDYETPKIDPLYNVLEVPNSKQDLPKNGPNTTQEPLYNVLEGLDANNAPVNSQDPGNDPLYNVLEGPEASHDAYESGASATQEPLYNVLDSPDVEKSPLVPASPSNEPLYNVLDGPDSDGSNQGAPKEPISSQAHDNPAYEQTLEFNAPYAAVQRPGAQRESVYEPLRKPAQDPYESIG